MNTIPFSIFFLQNHSPFLKISVFTIRSNVIKSSTISPCGCASKTGTGWRMLCGAVHFCHQNIVESSHLSIAAKDNQLQLCPTLSMTNFCNLLQMCTSCQNYPPIETGNVFLPLNATEVDMFFRPANAGSERLHVVKSLAEHCKWFSWVSGCCRGLLQRDMTDKGRQ